jgi:hypothetical protein
MVYGRVVRERLESGMWMHLHGLGYSMLHPLA